MINTWKPYKGRLLTDGIGNEVDVSKQQNGVILYDDFISYMDNIPLRELLIEFLIADPHKGMNKEEVDKIRNFLDQESKRRGFDSWIDAYHKL